MKVAVPTRGNVVEDHFGHCDAYTVFTVDADKKFKLTEVVPSPNGCGCKSNIAAILREKGVNVMLAGNMGDGALQVLRHHGIEVYRGCSGNVHKLMETFANGSIEDSGEACHEHNQHDQGHQCNH